MKFVVVVDLESRAGRHLSSWCRANAVPLPISLEELASALTARSGLASPRVDVEPAVLDSDSVVLAHKYEAAARLMGLSSRQVRRLVAEDELPVVEVGTARLVAHRGIEDFIERHRHIREASNSPQRADCKVEEGASSSPEDVTCARART